MAPNQLLILWVAQGFGSGRLRVAPGTFGSLLGIGWSYLLYASGNLLAYLAGILLVAAAAVWVCGAAERVLGQTDPSSVVLDEIAAFPICFLPSLVQSVWVSGRFPDLMENRHALWFVPAIFVLFRLFDILKPWPVRQIQALPAGWGVVMDDIFAALYVCLVSLAAGWLWLW